MDWRDIRFWVVLVPFVLVPGPPSPSGVPGSRGPYSPLWYLTGWCHTGPFLHNLFVLFGYSLILLYITSMIIITIIATITITILIVRVGCKVCIQFFWLGGRPGSELQSNLGCCHAAMCCPCQIMQTALEHRSRNKKQCSIIANRGICPRRRIRVPIKWSEDQTKFMPPEFNMEAENGTLE